MCWRAAAVCRREIGRRTVLFSEQTQQIVALNDGAAAAWRALEAGVPCEQLAAAGSASPGMAELLAAWVNAGLIHSGNEPAAVPGEAEAGIGSRTFEIGLAAVRLKIGDGIPAEDIWPYLAHFPEHSRKPQASLSIGPMRSFAPDGDVTDSDAVGSARFRLCRGKRRLVDCARSEVVPALRAQLTAEVIEHGAYVLALHAAALIVDGRLLLVTGPPGRGKSTLATALLSAGCGFAADDLVLLDSDGIARGVPLWPGLKEGSWDLLGSLRGDLAACPVHHRPDGRAVRYLPPGADVSGARLPVGWIVVLSEPEGSPKLSPADPLRAMEALIAGASAPGNRLTKEGYGALALLVENAACFSLGRLPISEAVAAIRGVFS